MSEEVNEEKQGLLNTDDQMQLATFPIKADNNLKNFPFPSALRFLEDLPTSDKTHIYIWNSARNGGIGVGHISISFKNIGTDQEIYISFWPENQVKISTADGAWLNRYEDYMAEKRPPEYAKQLKLLNIKNMFDKYQQIKNLEPQWHLLGSTPLKEKLGSLNCIGVAVAILKAGGLEVIAQEEIAKNDTDFLDKGLFPYRRNEAESCIKLCCYCGWGCIKLVVGCVFITFFAISLPVTGFLLIGGSGAFLTDWLGQLPAWGQILLGCMFVATIIGLCYAKFCTNKNDTRERDYSLGIDPQDMLEAGTGTASALVQVAQTSTNIIEVPYDTLRGFVEHSLTPDGRIKEIIEKAEIIELNQFIIPTLPHKM